MRLSWLLLWMLLLWLHAAHHGRLAANAALHQAAPAAADLQVAPAAAVSDDSEGLCLTATGCGPASTERGRGRCCCRWCQGRQMHCCSRCLPGGSGYLLLLLLAESSQAAERQHWLVLQRIRHEESVQGLEERATAGGCVNSKQVHAH